eukprot:2211852-Rhodomonas_salina.1
MRRSVPGADHAYQTRKPRRNPGNLGRKRVNPRSGWVARPSQPSSARRVTNPFQPLGIPREIQSWA